MKVKLNFTGKGCPRTDHVEIDIVGDPELVEKLKDDVRHSVNEYNDTVKEPDRLKEK